MFPTRVIAVIVCLMAAASIGHFESSVFAAEQSKVVLRETFTRRTSGNITRRLLILAPWTVQSKRPLVALNHGFGRSPAQMEQVGVALVRRGYVVLLTSGINGETSARDIAALLTAKRPLVTQRTRPNEVILMGHSAGGAASLVSAARLQPQGVVVRATVLLDGVSPRLRDIAGLSTETLRIVSLRAEPSPCNAMNAITPFLRTLGASTLDVRVVGSTHCDPEGPSDKFCGWSCGDATPAMQKLFRELSALVIEDSGRSDALDLSAVRIRNELDALAKNGKVVWETWPKDD